jgi:hypothetical protein
MFLSIMLVLQSSIPCSENFNRYKRNYEKYLTSNPDSKDKPRSEVEVRMIASPRLMSKLKPFDNMNLVGGSSPDQLNFNPESQKILLQMAANRKADVTQGPGSDDDVAGEGANNIAVGNFKSNKTA